MLNRNAPQREAAAIRTVFLDRDGVINRKMPEGEYVTSWDKLEVLPGAPAAIKKMNDAGLQVLVASNQRCIALGLCTRMEVDSIHERLQDLLQKQGSHIDCFYICEHDRGVCDCRKPGTGMFRQAVADFPSISAETSVMIGDSLSDMEFGRRARMRTIFIEGDPLTKKAGAERGRDMADAICGSLEEAVEQVFRWPTER
jgi:D-glycero-D-manno-heptose 1,7-bisphosphate phosphatase